MLQLPNNLINTLMVSWATFEEIREQMNICQILLKGFVLSSWILQFSGENIALRVINDWLILWAYSTWQALAKCFTELFHLIIRI